jgi:type VI secretion system secreted protein VgrG
VVVRGYNYERANAPIQVKTDIQETDTGVVNVFDELIADEKSATDYGKIIKERYLCEQSRCFGTSYDVLVFPGKITQLQGHYCPRLNQRFLVLSIRHQGSVRKSILTRYTNVEALSLPDAPAFQCDYEGLAITIQYRDAIRTPINRISGVIQAKLDSEGTSGNEDIDQYGRYKIIFLQEEKPDGGAGKHSNRIRKQEAYVGAGFGVHHPLAPGVEVLIAFLHGNPNLPLITGAAYNSQNKNVVSQDSAHKNVQKSGAGQMIIIDEKNGFTAVYDGSCGAAFVVGNTSKGVDDFKPSSLVANPF